MKKLTVERRQGKYPLDIARQRFEDYGIVVLKEFLPIETMQQLRTALEHKLAHAEKEGAVRRLPLYPKAEFLLGDLLSIRELESHQYIFFKAELLELIRHLLGSQDLVYFGDSNVTFGEAARGFHKDNVDRYDGSKDDWQTDYGLIRCGFYCQDHAVHSGGLKIRLASHNIPTHRQGRIVDVKTSYGDLALWNMRLTHSGNNRKLRLLSGIHLHPRVEMVLPAVLTAPEQMRRISAFCTFGRPGTHLDRYIESMNSRSQDYKAYFQRARKTSEAQSMLQSLSITMRQPNDYYGELD